MKRKLVSFFEYFSYVDRVVPLRLVPRKQKKQFINTCLIMEVVMKEDMQILFSE